MTHTNKSTSNKTALTRRNWLKAAAAMSTTTAISSQFASCTQADEPTPKTDDIASRHVLFAFDDESIPLIRGVELKMQRPEKHSANPIIARGAHGQPDAERAHRSEVIDRFRRKLLILWDEDSVTGIPTMEDLHSGIVG